MDKKLVCVRLQLFDKDGKCLDTRTSDSFFSDTLEPGREKIIPVTWGNVANAVNYYRKCTPNRTPPFSLNFKKMKVGLELQWHIHFIDNPLKDLKQCSDQLEMKLVMSIHECVPENLRELFKLDFDSAVRYLKEYVDKIKE